MRTLTLLTTLLLAACTYTPLPEPSPSPRPDPAPEPPALGTTLRIATDATFPPFHYVADDATITGYDVEFAREAARRAGYEPKIIRDTDYDAMFKRLRDAEYDVIAATTGITPPRRRTYLFSTPYYETCQAGVVRAGPDEPKSRADLEDKRVAAAGSGSAFLAMMSMQRVTHVPLDPGQDAEAMLLRGDIDAFVIDEYDAVKIAKENPELRVLPQPIAPEQYALVLNIDSKKLQADLNKAIASMQADGTVADLRARFNLNRPPTWPVKLH